MGGEINLESVEKLLKKRTSKQVLFSSFRVFKWTKKTRKQHAIICILSLIPSILNFVNYVTNDTLENNLKRRISRRQIKVFTKKLAKDYEKEKINSQKFHEQNLIFNESRQGIFRAGLEMHLENRNIITEEIKSILSSYLPSLTEELDSSSESLSVEELNNVQTIVKGYQKTLKR